MISFSYVNIDCNIEDHLYLFNENKSTKLFDYCNEKNNKFTDNSHVMTTAKYLVARMQTSSSKYLSAIFDLIYIDFPPLMTLQFSHADSVKPPEQSLEITNERNYFIKDSLRIILKFLFLELCPTNPTIIIEKSGTLNSPAFKKGYSYTAHCSWIIRAPINQVKIIL